MKNLRYAIAMSLVPLLLAACRSEDRPARVAVANSPTGKEAGKAPANDGFDLTSSKDGDTSAGMPILPDDLAKATIPASLHGRWGLVAADCTSTRGDAKGLIVIADRSVKFYESLATLKAQRPSVPESFSGLFDFSGEGQRWQKVMTFTRNGERLTRADQDGNFTYLRCA